MVSGYYRRRTLCIDSKTIQDEKESRCDCLELDQSWATGLTGHRDGFLWPSSGPVLDNCTYSPSHLELFFNLCNQFKVLRGKKLNNCIFNRLVQPSKQAVSAFFAVARSTKNCVRLSYSRNSSSSSEFTRSGF